MNAVPWRSSNNRFPGWRTFFMHLYLVRSFLKRSSLKRGMNQFLGHAPQRYMTRIILQGSDRSQVPCRCISLVIARSENQPFLSRWFCAVPSQWLPFIIIAVLWSCIFGNYSFWGVVSDWLHHFRDCILVMSWGSCSHYYSQIFSPWCLYIWVYH